MSVYHPLYWRTRREIFGANAVALFYCAGLPIWFEIEELQ